MSRQFRLSLCEPEKSASPVSRLVLENAETALARAIKEAEGTDTTLCVVGGSEHFSYGADLKALAGATPAQLEEYFCRVEQLRAKIVSFPGLTVSIARGFCLGIGADLAMACDVRAITRDCTLSFPGSRFGVVLGLARLAEILGPARATSAQMFGTKFGPDEALASGLVHRVEEQSVSDRVIADTIVGEVRTPGATICEMRGLLALADTDTEMAALRRSIGEPDAIVRRIAEFVSGGFE